MNNDIGSARTTAMEKAGGSAKNYTSSSNGGSTKSSSERDRNKKLTLNKDFKAGLLTIKDQSNVQAFL